ncbi:MAG TPA: anthranilate phosphoribosyltransferase [Phycisphaerales bacterium]|nr:anthranilate phosphoribosyltransferase [Phycisphaerales bacterium]
MTEDVSNAVPAPSEFPKPDQDADLTPFLRILLSGRSLTEDESSAAFDAMMSGRVHHGEMGALLALLATRIPTTDELVGAARVMRRNVTGIEVSGSTDDILDTAGTGGAPKTFNVSTAAAIVSAGAGVKVAKHGNRSRTGRGSAEALQSLGVDVDADPGVQARCLDEVGICFCFAIHHHPATRHVMPVRKALGVPTMFNLLGPLTNPAGAGRQVMGIYDDRFLTVIAETLDRLGTRRAVIVHSEDGLDECSISAPTTIVDVRDGSIERSTIRPEDVGLETAEIGRVTAADLDHATEMIRGVIDGKLHGPPRDMTILNSAVALLAAGRCTDLGEGVRLAGDSIDSGRSLGILERLVECSRG